MARVGPNKMVGRPMPESYRQKSVEYFLARAVEGPNGCLLWPGSLSKGYARASVWGETVQVHRFIAESRLPPEDRPSIIGLEACHTCDIRHCINPEHTFFGTQLENVADMMSKGRGNKARNERTSTAKLTKEDVIAMRQLYKQGSYSQRQLATMFNMCRSTVSRILMYKAWANI